MKIFHRASKEEEASAVIISLENDKGKCLYSTPESKISEDTQIIIGRGETCTWRIPDEAVSHKHAAISKRRDKLLLTDLGSRNHTTDAKGTSITGEVAMKPGDVFYIARNKLVVQKPRHSAYFIEYLDNKQKVVKKKLERDRTVVGRSHDCDIVLPDTSVSHRHFSLSIDNQDNCWIIDEYSTHGTWVDGEKLKAGGTKLMQNGNRIKVGSSTLLFGDENADDQIRPLLNVGKALGIAFSLVIICFLGFQVALRVLRPSVDRDIKIVNRYILDGYYDKADSLLNKLPWKASVEQLKIINQLHLVIVKIRNLQKGWETVKTNLQAENYPAATETLNQLLDEQYEVAWRRLEKSKTAKSGKASEVKPEKTENEVSEQEKAKTALKCIKLYNDYTVIRNAKKDDKKQYESLNAELEGLLKTQTEVFAGSSYMDNLFLKLNEGQKYLQDIIRQYTEYDEIVSLLGKETLENISEKLEQFCKIANDLLKGKAGNFKSVVCNIKTAKDNVRKLEEYFWNLQFEEVQKYQVWPEEYIDSEAHFDSLANSIDEEVAKIKEVSQKFRNLYGYLEKSGITEDILVQMPKVLADFLDEEKQEKLCSFEWVENLVHWMEKWKYLPESDRDTPISLWEAKEQRKVVNLCDELLHLDYFMAFLKSLQKEDMSLNECRERSFASIYRFQPEIIQCHAIFEAAEIVRKFMDENINKELRQKRVGKVYEVLLELDRKRKAIIAYHKNRKDAFASREFLVSRGIALYFSLDKENGTLRKELIEAYKQNLENIKNLKEELDKANYEAKDVAKIRELRKKILNTGYPLEQDPGTVLQQFIEAKGTQNQ